MYSIYATWKCHKKHQNAVLNAHLQEGTTQLINSDQYADNKLTYRVLDKSNIANF